MMVAVCNYRLCIGCAMAQLYSWIQVACVWRT